jgi:hypothetical protein
MNQDQLIRFLMDNIDAEALAEANRQGSTIMYYAGVAQRFPNTQTAATNTRTTGRMNTRPQAMPVFTAEPRGVEIQATNETNPTPAPPRTPARRNARNGNEGDTVRVGRL